MAPNNSLVHGYLAAFATLCMWSCFSLVSRYGAKTELSAYDIYAIRLITASVLLLPFVKHVKSNAWRDLRLWGLILLSNLIYCPLIFSAFKYAPAAHGGILLAGMQPFLISIVIWFFEGRRPSKQRFVGLCLIAFGILSAAVPYFLHWSFASVFGDFLMILGSICWAFYGVLAMRWRYGAWELTCGITFGAAVVYLPIYALFLPKGIAEASLTSILVQSFFQGAVATILAMLAYLKTMEKLGAERSAVILSLVPIIVGLAAYPLLDEPLTPWLMAGLVLVSFGAIIASMQASSLTAMFKKN